MPEADPVSVVIAAGGTGGHIFPGLALAEAIAEIRPEAKITFVGTRRGLEKKLIPEAGYPLEFVDMVPFTGVNRFVLPFALLRSAFQSMSILRSVSASVAVGMGGYASAPLMLGAKLGRLPSILHESGAIAGKSNLLAAKFARNVAVAFEQAAPAFGGRFPKVVGMPLNSSLIKLDRKAARDEARKRLGLPQTGRLLLVMGGSQGAASLNSAAVGLSKRWAERRDIHILLKAGAKQADEIKADLEREGRPANIDVVSFIDDIADAYAAADMAVCRAGAGTVAELAVLHLPSILVPYPHAPGDHQALNARPLVDAGGAYMVRDKEATAERLGSMLESMLDVEGKLEAMQRASAAASRPDAAYDLATWVLELAEAKER